MLDERTRTTILTLHGQSHGTRAIAGMVGVSRNAVKKVIQSNSAQAPRIERVELGAP